MGKIHDSECFLSKGFTDGYYGGWVDAGSISLSSFPLILPDIGI